MSFKNIAKLFGSHYAMERFCVFAVMIFIAVIAVMAWIGLSMHGEAVAAFEETAVFEKEAVGTQSGVSASVEGFAVNQNRTRCVLYLSFGDAGGISSDADSYKVHVTAVNDALNAQRAYNMGIKGSFYLYGTTGKALIYMTCPSGFDDGAYKVFLEGTSLVQASDDVQASDVFEFSIHPASSSAIVSESLEGESFDATAFYADVMLASDERSVKDEMEGALGLMDGYLNSIVEYGKRLEESGISTEGALPALVEGDTVGKDANGRLFLTTANDFPNALKVDWRNSSVVSGGYSKDVDMGAMSLSEYIAAYKTLPADTMLDGNFDHVWTFVDGRVFDEVAMENASSRYQEMAADIARFEGTVSSYLAVKQLYQTVYPLELLSLEEDAMTMADTVKVAVDCVEPY